MHNAPPLRAVALALAGWTLMAGVSGPPCLEPASCPMDETAAAPACDGMSSDCCQPAGEKAPQGPAPAAPAPLAVAVGIVAAVAALPPPALQLAPVEHPPPPAALQGLGLYTLFAAFLI